MVVVVVRAFLPPSALCQCGRRTPRQRPSTPAQRSLVASLPPSSCWTSPSRPVLAVFAVRLAVASARTPGFRRTRSSGSCRFSHCRERADSPPKPERHQRHRGHCRLVNRMRAEPQLKPQRRQHCRRLGQLAWLTPKTKTLGVACPACGRGQKTKGDSPSSPLVGEDSEPGTPRFSYQTSAKILLLAKSPGKLRGSLLLEARGKSCSGYYFCRGSSTRCSNGRSSPWRGGAAVSVVTTAAAATAPFCCGGRSCTCISVQLLQLQLHPEVRGESFSYNSG